MGLFSAIGRELGGLGGKALGGLLGNSDIGESIGREVGGFGGSFIPFKKGGVVMTSAGPMMVMKPTKAKKGKGKSTMAMKKKMAKVRAAKKK
ncbi:MAG: hypothetical protein ACOYNN_16640 [Terrimicrobiaceae bacterium]